MNNTGSKEPEFEDLVLFTSTYYKDDKEGQVRQEVFFELLRRASMLWVKIVISDGGSAGDFMKKLSKYRNAVAICCSGESMGEWRRLAAKEATKRFPDAKYFFWTEPEKANLIKAENLRKLIDPIMNWKANIVVPERCSMKGVPVYQRNVEIRANLRAAGIIENRRMVPLCEFKNALIESNGSAIPTKNPYDLWFGPKVFDRKSLEEEFLGYDGEKWDSIIAPVVTAILNRKSVAGIPVDYEHPQSQSEMESSESFHRDYALKRRIQYRQVIKAIKKQVDLYTN